MLINCVKVVKKSAQKMFIQNVYNYEDVDIFSIFHTTKKVFRSFRQSILTTKKTKSYLKMMSFARFPQTSTITTNIIKGNF